MRPGDKDRPCRGLATARRASYSTGMAWNIARLLAIPALALAAGCASTTGDYPTLDMREGERVSGTLAAPVAAAPTPPAPPAPVNERATALAEQARAAHAAFLETAGAVRAPIAQSAGAAPGSDAWSAAQLALAELSTNRSEVMVALAELDLLYLQAANAGQALGPIGETRAGVEALVADEDRLLDALSASVAD